MGHTCLHLENLRNTLRSRLETVLCPRGDEVTMDPKDEKSLHEFLAKCVDRHVQLLRYVVLERIFKWIKHKPIFISNFYRGDKIDSKEFEDYQNFNRFMHL